MDLVALTSFLAPVLPFLLGMAGKAADAAAGEFGKDRFNQAKTIWGKLRPKLAEKPAAEEAAIELAAQPDDPDLQTVFRMQLKKIVESDPALAAELAQLMQQTAPTSATQINQTVTGDSNQTIGQMSGNAKAIGSVDGTVTM
jgi:hypothetical protein